MGFTRAEKCHRLYNTSHKTQQEPLSPRGNYPVHIFRVVKSRQIYIMPQFIGIFCDFCRYSQIDFRVLWLFIGDLRVFVWDLSLICGDFGRMFLVRERGLCPKNSPMVLRVCQCDLIPVPPQGRARRGGYVNPAPAPDQRRGTPPR